MEKIKNSLNEILLESKGAIKKQINSEKISLLDDMQIEMGKFDFFEEAAVYDKDRNIIFVKENSFETLEQLKHIVTHECYHIISVDFQKDISGFMNIHDKEKLRGLNEGYTELLAMSTMPDDEHIVYLPQIVMTNLITKMISKEKMDDYYFNNKPEELYQDLVDKLKDKEVVDNLLTCLTLELKPRQESILGTMEYSTMALLIENNDLTYEEYYQYREMLVGYNHFLVHPLFQDKFSSCKDVVKNLDQLYAEKEKMKMVNESNSNQVVLEGVKKT